MNHGYFHSEKRKTRDAWKSGFRSVTATSREHKTQNDPFPFAYSSVPFLTSVFTLTPPLHFTQFPLFSRSNVSFHHSVARSQRDNWRAGEEAQGGGGEFEGGGEDGEEEQGGCGEDRGQGKDAIVHS